MQTLTVIVETYEKSPSYSENIVECRAMRREKSTSSLKLDMWQQEQVKQSYKEEQCILVKGTKSKYLSIRSLFTSSYCSNILSKVKNTETCTRKCCKVCETLNCRQGAAKSPRNVIVYCKFAFLNGLKSDRKRIFHCCQSSFQIFTVAEKLV